MNEEQCLNCGELQSMCLCSSGPLTPLGLTGDEIKTFCNLLTKANNEQIKMLRSVTEGEDKRRKLQMKAVKA